MHYSRNNFKYSKLDLSSSRVTRALYFYRTILRDNTITSTSSIGKEVYNIKDKASSKNIGYLGFLVNKDKLDSLSSYILNLGLKFNSSNFFIIISYNLENKFYYLKVNRNRVESKEWLSSSKDLSLEFRRFKSLVVDSR